MTVNQSDCYDLQQHLQTVPGEKMGNMLLEHLPPSGWSDVARACDIDMIRQEMRNLEVRIDTRLDMIDLQLTQLSKRVSYAVTTGMAMFATLLALLINLRFSV